MTHFNCMATGCTTQDHVDIIWAGATWIYNLDDVRAVRFLTAEAFRYVKNFKGRS